MSYDNRMERAGGWLTPRPGCPVKLDDGKTLRTGDRIAADDPIAQRYRHRLMVLSAAPDPPRPAADDEEDDDG